MYSFETKSLSISHQKNAHIHLYKISKPLDLEPLEQRLRLKLSSLEAVSSHSGCGRAEESKQLLEGREKMLFWVTFS